jgi:hypothetical protein
MNIHPDPKDFRGDRKTGESHSRTKGELKICYHGFVSTPGPVALIPPLTPETAHTNIAMMVSTGLRRYCAVAVGIRGRNNRMQAYLAKGKSGFQICRYELRVCPNTILSRFHCPAKDIQSVFPANHLYTATFNAGEFNRLRYSPQY